MNQRIRELAKDCGYQHKPLTSLDEVDDFKYFDLERFAESIVHECIETLGTCEDYWTHEHRMTALKRHFGVE